jgi:DNA-directed RNA polymerase subunit RPC12/RpoP
MTMSQMELAVWEANGMENPSALGALNALLARMPLEAPTGKRCPKCNKRVAVKAKARTRLLPTMAGVRTPTLARANQVGVPRPDDEAVGLTSPSPGAREQAGSGRQVRSTRRRISGQRAAYESDPTLNRREDETPDGRPIKKPDENSPAQAARHFGGLKAALKAKGKQTKPYDLLIGAHARAIDATLVTDDADDFRHMPGLRLVNWLRR